MDAMGQCANGHAGLIVNENGRVPQAEKAFTHYESVLYSFYNRELSINDSDMETALRDCYDLINIGDYLGCTTLISKPIEVALFKQGQALFRSIQGRPHLYLDLAYRTRSELIFRECMVHLAGNWAVLRREARVGECLRSVPGVRGLVEKYHQALLDKGKKLETHIMASYPGTMAAPSDDVPIKREVYARDILVWMALTFFRHWLAQRLMLDKGRTAPDGGFELYRQLGAGGDAYMDRSVIVQFHSRFPMTKKALNVLENHVLEIKACMAEIVKQHGILDARCQLDILRSPVSYLACTEFQRADLPWLKDAASAVVPRKREYQPGGNDIARANLETAKRFQKRSASAEDEDEESEEEE
jgi:hypothetical protein